MSMSRALVAKVMAPCVRIGRLAALQDQTSTPKASTSRWVAKSRAR